ncbi:carbohydrate ABC transporter permease [Acidiphilium iwatense]|uniref:Carbohydrate ABC transporter permease n=1 Tax=Acidiphilium iwatense TaxID=768198 RepID=A0ABS9E0C6_9PROT|nr:carbohydrate ABC transporter permease [Acidiphilium iwatense]MCF3947127.1 carbohydrate ABC transporter permease [Acidiphilium iwatense]
MILKSLRGVALLLVVLFFMFPIFWIVVMSLQTNAEILSLPPKLIFPPTLMNYTALITGHLKTSVGTLNIAFMHNLWNSFLLSALSVIVALVLGVPAAYAFARYKFRLGEDMAFTLLSLKFAPPLLVLLPLSLEFQRVGLDNTYIGLIWIYQLITLPLILWIVRGYFEDASPDIEYAYRVDGHSWLKGFLKIAIPLARPGIAAAVVLSIIPTLAIALYAQRWLVEGLSLGAVKG